MRRDPLDKTVYRMAEAAAIVGVPPSTLRFWEKEFRQLAPRRSRAGQRTYSSRDLRTMQLIHYLLHVKGLKIEAAKAVMDENPDGVSRESEVVTRLREIRSTLASLMDSL